MPTSLPPPPTGFWRWVGRTTAGVVAWLLLLLGMRLASAGLVLARHGVRATWMFRLASTALAAATWMRPDLTR